MCLSSPACPKVRSWLPDALYRARPCAAGALQGMLLHPPGDAGIAPFAFHVPAAAAAVFVQHAMFCPCHGPHTAAAALPSTQHSCAAHEPQARLRCAGLGSPNPQESLQSIKQAASLEFDRLWPAHDAGQGVPKAAYAAWAAALEHEDL